MRRRPSRAGGFSLVEVAAAVAIVAVALVVILGLLSGLARRADETQDRRVAAGLADAVTVELRRLTALRGWDAMAASAAAANEETGGIRLVAARDGGSLREWAAAEAPARDQYFLIEARRVGHGALAYRTGAPVLPLAVTVSWPYRPATAAGPAPEVPRSERHDLEFSAAVNR